MKTQSKDTNPQIEKVQISLQKRHSNQLVVFKHKILVEVDLENFLTKIIYYK